MPVTLGDVALDEAHTAVREFYEEVGGGDARRIELSGVVLGLNTRDAIEEALDAIIDAASAEVYSAALSLRAGRRLWVRRAKFRREVSRERLAGAYTLTLEAKDPFEEAVEETVINWPITASGQFLEVSSQGNVYAKPVITLIASGDLIEPRVSDGVRAMRYGGTIPNGSTLVFDAANERVLLDGAEVTPYATGEFPRIEPEGTLLTYTDAAGSSHSASASVAFRDRWW